MTYPAHLGSTYGTNTSGTSPHVTTLPTASAGDLLLLIFFTDGNESLSAAGWTTLYSLAATNTSMLVAYKTATGSDSAPSFSLGSSRNSGYIARAYSGAGALGYAAATGNSDTADPPHYSGGTFRDRVLVSAVGVFGTDPAMSTPTLSNTRSITDGWGSLYSGTINATDLSTDIDAYGLMFSSDWVAVTISIDAPAPPSNTGSGNPSNQPDGCGGSGNFGPQGMVIEQPDIMEASGFIGVAGGIEQGDTLQAVGEVTDTTTSNGNPIEGADAFSASGVVTGAVIHEQPDSMSASGSIEQLCGLVKVWNGSAWVRAPIKVWDGASWVTATKVKIYRGGSWIGCT